VQHWAERCLDRIVWIAEDADPVIKQQAQMFKQKIGAVLIQYMKNAIQSDRTTLYNLLLQQGDTKLAEIIRRL
jgi:hypothetical protein